MESNILFTIAAIFVLGLHNSVDAKRIHKKRSINTNEERTLRHAIFQIYSTFKDFQFFPTELYPNINRIYAAHDNLGNFSLRTQAAIQQAVIYIENRL